MITIPAVNGGAIVAVDSDELSTLSLNGLTVGTRVWNVDVGAFFTLTKMVRTEIALETTDTYDDPTWTLANATFTGFEGCTLVMVLTAPNVAFSRTYVIDTVGSATSVDVLDPPAGASTGEMFGSAVLYDDALVTDSVVDANGTTGLRWVVDSGPAPGTIVNAMIADDTINTLEKVDRSAIETMVTLSGAAQDINVTGLAGDTDGDYLIYANLILGTGGTCVIQPNGSDPSVAKTIDLYALVDTTTGSNGLTSNIKIGGAGVAATVTLVATLTSKSGVVRMGSSCTYVDASSDAMSVLNYAWLDTATVITSLKFHGSVSNLFGAGSFVRVIKLGHKN